MAKKTILQLVQTMGARIGSDEIDTLDETIESLELVGILEGVYEEVISRKPWKFLTGRVRQLEAREGGSVQYNTLAVPEDVTRIDSLKYRTNSDVESYTKLIQLPVEEFLAKIQSRNPTDADVATIINPDGVRLFIATNIAPTYWTSFDEENISFDAYDVTRGTGNLVADSVIIADIVPFVDFTDPASVLPVPQRMETLIINEAISTASVELRQQANPKAEQIARRQHIALRENEPVTNDASREVNYGRRTNSGR